MNKLENKIMFIDLSAEMTQLVALAEGVLNGDTFAESHWCGSGKVFTKSQFHQLRSEMLERGLIVWKRPDSPAQGLLLTAVGAHVLRRFLRVSPTPQLEGPRN